eukprot:PITA_09088
MPDFQWQIVCPTRTPTPSNYRWPIFQIRGIDFMTCNPRLVRGHGYIIIVVDYFMKWVEANGQVEAVNNVLITMLQCTVGKNRKYWHLMLFSTLWAYQTFAKTATTFNLFQLVYSLEATLPIECEIPSLKLAIELILNTSPEEEHLLYLERLDETCRIAAMVIEDQKKRVKAHFDQTVSPHTFAEGNLGAGKLEPMWHGPYIAKRVLQKGAYDLCDYEGNTLSQPHNGLYLKKYYA